MYKFYFVPLYVPLYADFPIRVFHRPIHKIGNIDIIGNFVLPYIFWSFLPYLHNTRLVNGKLDVDGYKTGADPGYPVGEGANPPWEGTNIQILPKTGGSCTPVFEFEFRN